MIFDGQFWAGNDGGVWRRPLTWHDRGQWTNLNANLHTTQNYSIAVGKVGQRAGVLGRPAGQRRVLHATGHAPRRAGVHR